jgi:quercetin dioxygenase-like cupin family protein
MPIGLSPNPRSSFAVSHLDEAALERVPLMDLPFNEGVQIRGYTAINQPNCQIIVEDFMPGQSLEWVFTHDEMQYCLSGEMDLTVWMPPLYAEKIETTIKAGTMYSFPVGARMRLTVTSDIPLRHICFCPPTPDYPFPTLDEIPKS